MPLPNIRPANDAVELIRHYRASINIAVDFDAIDGVLTLSSTSLMLRVHAVADDLLRLDMAHEARWDRRESLAVGTTALGQVFWCAGEAAGSVNVLVGQDDETWDLSLALPHTVMTEVVRLAKGDGRRP